MYNQPPPPGQQPYIQQPYPPNPQHQPYPPQQIYQQQPPPQQSNYQTSYSGISGWNDPPNKVSAKLGGIFIDEKVLDGVDNPGGKSLSSKIYIIVGFIMANLEQVLDLVINNIQVNNNKFTVNLF